VRPQAEVALEQAGIIGGIGEPLPAEIARALKARASPEAIMRTTAKTWDELLTALERGEREGDHARD
jgi:hypothetical protein